MIAQHHSARVVSTQRGNNIFNETYTGVLTPESLRSLPAITARHTPHAEGIIFDKSRAIITYQSMERVTSIREKPPAVAFIVPDGSFLMVSDYCQAMAASGLHWTAWLESQKSQADNWLEAFVLLRRK